MKRAPIKASKSVSQAGSVKTVTVRVSNGKSSVTAKASVKTR